MWTIGRFRLGFCVVCSICFGGISCSAPPAEQIEIMYPNPDSFGRRDRNFRVSETLDGSMRAFAAQRGDLTEIMLSIKQSDGEWSEPKIIELPKRETATTPHFSRIDGRLYFSTDAQHPERDGRTDLNIWSANISNSGEVSDIKPMDDSINTGAHEESPFFDANGRFFFSSDHTRGVGGFDIYQATKILEHESSWEVIPFPHNTYSADAHVALSPDGSSLYFYAHIPNVVGVVDIFRSDYVDGKWSTPVNLGGPINSTEIDYGPSFSSDGEWFYFSRQGQLMKIPARFALP